MIWILLELLTKPDDYAVTFRDGEIWVEPVAVLEANGARVR